MIITVTLNAAIDKRYEVNDFKIGNVNRVSRCTYAAGGKGINVARVAIIAGEDVTATGFVGGHAGALIEQSAGESGIKTDFVHVEGESRTCINMMDTITKEQTELLEGGETVSEDSQKRMLEKYEQLLKKADVITISGSVPKGVNSDLYIKMIEKARFANVPVLLDTSGQLLKDCLKAKPTLIKPNQDEMEQLLGGKITCEEELIQKGMELREKGIEYVVISLGGEGSLLLSPQGIYKARVPKLEVVNTVGCGDSMLAGFAIGFAKRLKPEEALRFASAISAANALQRETGFYLKEDFERIYPQISIAKIAD